MLTCKQKITPRLHSKGDFGFVIKYCKTQDIENNRITDSNQVVHTIYSVNLKICYNYIQDIDFFILFDIIIVVEKRRQ